jgi:hypothetical protein
MSRKTSDIKEQNVYPHFIHEIAPLIIHEKGIDFFPRI